MAKISLICGISIAFGVAAGVGLHLARAESTERAVPRLEVRQLASAVPRKLQIQTHDVTPDDGAAAAPIPATTDEAITDEEGAGDPAGQQPNADESESATDEPVSSDPERRSEQAVQEATAMIMSGGDWHNEDREAFNQKLTYMSAAEQEQMKQALVKAIDSGDLTPATSGSPL